MSDPKLPELDLTPLTAGMSPADLIDSAFHAFNAARIREACRLYATSLLRDDVTVGLSLSGALTPAGLGTSCLVPLIQRNYVDWIVTTGAVLYHDLHLGLGYSFYRGSPGLDDKELRKRKLIRIHAVIIEPLRGAIIAGAPRDSVYVSQDGGNTWERRDNGITETDIYSLASSRINGGARIYAGSEPAYLFYSDDLGRHWSELSALRSVDMSGWTFPAPPHIAHTKHINFHPDDPDTLFISIEQGGLLKSTDAGQHFQVIPGMDDDVHRTVINPKNPDRIYVTGGDGMYVTSEGGR
ncbi:MAG: deoxyhypusine synthase family protein, partial [Nitrospinae bacterium]|nr:deoxyhypusine synthase family protein [Nitrospinota bacterium]